MYIAHGSSNVCETTRLARVGHEERIRYQCRWFVAKVFGRQRSYTLATIYNICKYVRSKAKDVRLSIDRAYQLDNTYNRVKLRLIQAKLLLDKQFIKMVSRMFLSLFAVK